MDDEREALLCEWQAAREAYDEFLQCIFTLEGRPRTTRPSHQALRETTRLRVAEEAARERYYANRCI